MKKHKRILGSIMALIATLLTILLMGEPIKNSNHLIPTCGRQELPNDQISKKNII
jgi:hypothetical protein